jgi:hypothetical protein
MRRVFGLSMLSNNSASGGTPLSREAECVAAGDDDVVKDSDIHQTRGVLQALRDEFVA